MTPEQQRIAIAEACGWKPLAIRGFCQNKDGELEWFACRNPQVKWKFLPNYLNDLNAMHEAEKALTDAQHTKFRGLLAIVVGKEFMSCREIVSATAAQRAEAFLRTLNLWKTS